MSASVTGRDVLLCVCHRVLVRNKALFVQLVAALWLSVALPALFCIALQEVLRVTINVIELHASIIG